MPFLTQKEKALKFSRVLEFFIISIYPQNAEGCAERILSIHNEQTNIQLSLTL
jgi:hypothetical protein